jgi:quinol-cytochrome oxidoreductase complex cytochrome b subunit
MADSPPSVPAPVGMTAGPDTAGPDPLRIVRNILLAVLAVELLILVLTGVWLVFNYRPTGAGDVARSVQRTHISWIRATHRGVSLLALITAVGAGVAIFADAFSAAARRARAALVAIGLTLVLAVAAAGFTGYLLPWDLLSLRAVLVPSHYQGYRTAFGSNVRFAIIGHTEVTRSTLWRWFLVHSVALTIVIAGLLVLAAALRRRGRGAAA